MVDQFVVARDLGKSFGNTVVLKNLSFDVAPGDVVGVLGRNGAGKTTLLELVLGFSPASAGQVEVFGHESYRLPGVAKSRIGFVPQSDELIGQLTGADQIRVIRSFYKDWDDALIERLVRDWELDLSARIRSMSVGQRQKLSILLALGHRPDLLILDEPVASLDPIARRRFLEQIVEISSDGGRAVVFSSHIVSDIERLASKIWILKDQDLSFCGDVDSLRESVVRVHIRASAPLSGSLEVPNSIWCEVSGTRATAVVCDWSDELRSEIAPGSSAEIEIESLTLEDIFLELHR